MWSRASSRNTRVRMLAPHCEKCGGASYGSWRKSTARSLAIGGAAREPGDATRHGRAAAELPRAGGGALAHCDPRTGSAWLVLRRRRRAIPERRSSAVSDRDVLGPGDRPAVEPRHFAAQLRAAGVDVQPQTISDLLTRRRAPSLAMAGAVERAFGIPAGAWTRAPLP